MNRSILRRSANFSKARAILFWAMGWLAVLGSSLLQAKVTGLPALLAEDDDVNRLRELVPYVASLKPAEIPAALNQAIAGHGPGREAAIDALAGRWLEIDAPAALAFARQTTDREARSSIESSYYGTWAERDAAGALDAANHADGGERATAVWEIAHKVGRLDPRRADELIAGVHSAKLEDSAYFLFWNWAGKDLAQATQMLLQDAKTAGYSYPCEVQIWAVTDRLLDADPQAAAKWVAALPAGKLSDEGVDRLAAEWKKFDPDAVRAWLKSLPDSQEVRNQLMNVPKKSADKTAVRVAVDPAFAPKAGELEKILWESNNWHGLTALFPFVDGLTAAEFPQALEHLRNATDSNRDTVLDVLVARWWKADPAGAVKAIPTADAIYDMEFRERFLKDVYGGWARRDPEAALADATKDYHDIASCDVLEPIFSALARKDPAKTYVTFVKLHDPNSHMIVIPIFTEWAVRDLPAATKMLATEPQWQGAIEGIVIGLMRQGPATAMAWARHLPDKSRRDRALQDVALRWPDDPAAAMAWLEKSADFDGKDSAFEYAAVDWAVRNPAQALRHAVALPDGKERYDLISWGMAQWTYDDAEGAQHFAQQLPEGEMKKLALSAVLGNWSEFAPETAARAFAPITDELSPQDLANIARSWSDGEAASTVKWLDSLPASVDKAPAIGKIAENWYRLDPAAATSWVNQLPAGTPYDAGAQGICEALNGDLPPALKWAQSIRDPKLRHDTVYQAFQTATYHRLKYFMLDDNDEFKGEILAAKDLTDAEKNKFIAQLPRLVINRNLFVKPLSPGH